MRAPQLSSDQWFRLCVPRKQLKGKARRKEGRRIRCIDRWLRKIEPIVAKEMKDIALVSQLYDDLCESVLFGSAKTVFYTEKRRTAAETAHAKELWRNLNTRYRNAMAEGHIILPE